MITGNPSRGVLLFHFTFNSSDIDRISVGVAQYNRQRTLLGVKGPKVKYSIHSAATELCGLDSATP